MHWNGGLVETLIHHKHHVFPFQHTCATDFYLRMWYDSIAKCFFFGEFLVANTATSRQNGLAIFHLEANKGLFWTVVATSRINLFAWAIFLHGKRCNMHRVYCLINILNEWQLKLKKTFFDRVLQHSVFCTSECELSDVFKLTAIIEIHNRRHALQNKIYRIGKCARANWLRFS